MSNWYLPHRHRTGISKCLFFDGKYLFTQLFLTILNRNNKQKTNIPNHQKKNNVVTCIECHTLIKREWLQISHSSAQNIFFNSSKFDWQKKKKNVCSTYILMQVFILKSIVTVIDGTDRSNEMREVDTSI